jgi:hypothetical protein
LFAEEGKSISVRVDCLGMVPVRDVEGGTPDRHGTPALLRNEAGTLDGRRCDFWPGAFEGLDEGDSYDPTRFRVLAGGSRFESTADLKVEVERTIGDWYLLGRYSGTFVNQDTNEEAQVQGWVDICDQVTHPECPYTIDGALPYRFETTNDLAPVWGEATSCRAVIDTATGGLQVDMQAAVWNGNNITQLYRSSCPEHEDSNPDWYANRLTFRAAGVTGPGNYGPWRVTDFGGVQLPSIEWTVPAVFAAAANRVEAGAFTPTCNDPAPYVLRTVTYDGAGEGNGSTCSFSITAGDPGRVFIECVRVEPDRVFDEGLLCDENSGFCGGNLDFSADCEVIIR